MLQRKHIKRKIYKMFICNMRVKFTCGNQGYHICPAGRKLQAGQKISHHLLIIEARYVIVSAPIVSSIR